jgi:TRAP-type C4-dicarboxylate transport system permease small subunit
MVALIFAAGIARLCLYPINWAIDLGTCLFAWSCFLSADITWREDKLMNVDILIRKFPANVRRYLRLVNYTILFGFLAYFVIFGLWLSYTTRARTFQGIPGFSYTWVTLSVPVSALLMFINTIIKFKRDIHSFGARDRKGIDPLP